MMPKANTLVLLAIFHVVPYFCNAMPSTRKLTLSQSCLEKGYCFEKHPEYPQEIVDGLLRDMNIMNITVVNQRKRRAISRDFDFSDCDGKTRNDMIHEIVDSNDVVRVVVQSREHFLQLIQIEECLNPGRILKSSRYFMEAALELYEVYCEEVTIDPSFLALTLDWTKLEMVKSKHKIPVACICRQHGSD